MLGARRYILWIRFFSLHGGGGGGGGGGHRYKNWKKISNTLHSQYKQLSDDHEFSHKCIADCCDYIS